VRKFRRAVVLDEKDFRLLLYHLQEEIWKGIKREGISGMERLLEKESRWMEDWVQTQLQKVGDVLLKNNNADCFLVYLGDDVEVRTGKFARWATGAQVTPGYRRKWVYIEGSGKEFAQFCVRIRAVWAIVRNLRDKMASYIQRAEDPAGRDQVYRKLWIFQEED
jgi:hypothetical protein